MPTLHDISMAIDPDAWDASRWPMTRAGVEGMHQRRQAANVAAARVAALWHLSLAA